MAEESSGAIREPQALRALAHPVRWKLIDLLTALGQATATQCATALGESVASCSHHLRMLAKYGFIEPAPTSNREKPWRMASFRQNLTGVGPEGEQAAHAATEVFLQHELARLVDRLRAARQEPPQWRDATSFTGTTTWLDLDELRDVNDQLREIAQRYVERIDDPSTRPSGAREVRIFVATSVAPTGERADD